MEMHFLTSSYDYLARWLLSYLEAVEVVSPESLKKIMAGYAERLYAHHHLSAN
jgi:predicted DNA-binding transcriptional regulator YafY